jgi:putative sigma-54 modulation protein
MQVNISTRHGEISEATQERITEKVGKLKRYFDRLMAVNVIVDLEKTDEPKLEIIVTPEHKHDFIANHQSKDMFASVDQVVAKLEQQIKKYKEKIQER